jgi:DNA mismatch repair protein MutS2
VACASFGYDPRSYEPTYRLELGAPGRSLALEMAERLGLPQEWVDDARGRRDLKQAQAEELLKSLEVREADLLAQEQRIAALRREAEEALQRARQAERELVARKRSEAEAFARDLRRRAEESARKAAEAIQQAVRRVEETRRSVTAVGEKARAQALREVREAHEEVLKDEALGLAPEPELSPDALRLGARVRVGDLGVVGEVVEMLAHGELELAVGGKRLRVPRGAVSAVLAGSRGHAPAPMRGKAPVEARKTPSAVPAEINLVGLTVDEALPRVDKLLDDAALSDRSQLRVIHGFGQGRLRRAVAELLEGHPHVASFRAGSPGEGGGGVTVVELKE